MRIPVGRLLLLSALGSVSALVWRLTRPATPRPAPADGAPDPFPFRPIPRPERAPAPLRAVPGPGTGNASAPAPSGDADEPWVEPVDGECPISHPVKANTQSRIFHVPGGGSYERTTPQRCYRTPADAEADGFRAAKR
jgi:hypothetical protein